MNLHARHLSGSAVKMAGSSVPMLSILVFALIGLIGFLAGFLLRREHNAPKEFALVEQPTAIVLQGVAETAAAAMVSVAPEAAATLQAASQVINHLHGMPACPTCGERMELREFKGKRVWLCLAFPACRGARMML